MKQRRSQQARAGRCFIQSWLPSRREKVVVEFERQSQYSFRVREIRIESAGPQLHAASSQNLNLAALRKGGSPNLPERIFSHHLRAVGFDAFAAFGENSRLPTLARSSIWENATRNSSGP